jgi:hypothetical protein
MKKLTLDPTTYQEKINKKSSKRMNLMMEAIYFFISEIKKIKPPLLKEKKIKHEVFMELLNKASKFCDNDRWERFARHYLRITCGAICMDVLELDMMEEYEIKRNMERMDPFYDKEIYNKRENKEVIILDEKTYQEELHNQVIAGLEFVQKLICMFTFEIIKMKRSRLGETKLKIYMKSVHQAIDHYTNNRWNLTIGDYLKKICKAICTDLLEVDMKEKDKEIDRRAREHFIKYLQNSSREWFGINLFTSKYDCI